MAIRAMCQVLLGVLSLGGVAIRAADPPSNRLSLAELQAAVADKFGSIQSLYVTHTFTHPKSTGGRTSRHVWAQEGSRVLFRTEYTEEAIGFWLSFDGVRSYNVAYDNDRKPVQVEIKDLPPNLGITCYFAKLLGWYIGQGESSLIDAMGMVSELTESDDKNIYVVSIHSFISRPNPTPLNVTFYLDGQHDYLPREVAFSDVSNPTWKFKYTVDEFGRIRDAVSQQDRWFPMKGRYTQETPRRGVEEFSLVASEVRINESLPDSVFIPEMPKGMSVIDNTEKSHGKFYVVGGFSSTDDQLKRLAAEAEDKLGIRTRATNRIVLVLLNICLMVGVGLFVLRARRRKHSASK